MNTLQTAIIKFKNFNVILNIPITYSTIFQITIQAFENKSLIDYSDDFNHKMGSKEISFEVYIRYSH